MIGWTSRALMGLLLLSSVGCSLRTGAVADDGSGADAGGADGGRTDGGRTDGGGDSRADSGGADGGSIADASGVDGGLEEDSGPITPPPTPSFEYAPTHFDPDADDVDPSTTAPTTTLDCGVSTFDSTSLAFDNWCGQPLPTPVAQTQAGGPEVVVLPMRGLSIATGASLALTGERPVVLAVFGDAAIDGVIDASAVATTPGAGGHWSCGACHGRSGGSTGAGCDAGGNRSGGGGAGRATVGAAGGDASSGVSGKGGVVVASEPLYGGCPGGAGGTQFSPIPAGGAGAGAVQISVARTLSIDGTIAANGAAGMVGIGNSTVGGGAAGGGSGGTIALEGDHITTGASSLITTNGGAGGAGSNRSTAAAGGAGGSAGTGSAPPTEGGDGSGYNGAGGGGGAVGYLYLRAITGCALAGTRSASETLECP